MVYAIYEDFYPDVEKKLSRIAKKCVKHGNDFKWEIIGEQMEKRTNFMGVTSMYRFLLVEVEGTAKINNWEFVATLERVGEENIIRRFNNEIEIPVHFRNAEPICEHCNSKRYRKNLYLIHNTETDEWKQVGGSCLMVYTNGLNMEYVAAYMDGITKLEESCGMDNLDGNIFFNPKHFDSIHVLASAYALTKKYGYTSTKSEGVSTKVLVIECMTTGDWGAFKRWLKGNGLDDNIYPEDIINEKTIAEAEKISAYYLSLNDDSEFVHNIKAMLKHGSCSKKSVGYLAYCPVGYAKYIQKQIELEERRKANADMQHFGEIGKRYKNQKILSFETVASWDNGYGYTYIHRIIIEGGYVLTWKTSNACVPYSILDEDTGKHREQIFDTITFTVKEHGEFKGCKQTEVTRAKVEFK